MESRGDILSLQVLPLAVTMIIGPGLVADIILVTALRPVRLCLAFIVGVSIAVTVGVLITSTLATLLDSAVSLGDASSSGSIGKIIQYLIVGLLIVRSIQAYARRKTSEQPGWMGALQNADGKLAFKMGLLLIFLMPSDIAIMITVGVNLAHNDAGLLAALPFIAATVLVAALPLLFYLLFRRRAQRVMPSVRNWMNTHSWLVNIVVYVVFIVIIL